MKPWARAAAVGATAMLAASCANPSLREPADDVTDALREMPGVASVRLGYTEPVTLDSGKIALRVRMDDHAAPDEIVDTGATAYHAFRTTHDEEEADLDIVGDRYQIHLRSFESSASDEAVRAELERAVGALAVGRIVAEVTTQDVSGGDHVRSTFTVHLGPRTGSAEVLTALDSLEKMFGPDTFEGWGVIAATGDGVRTSSGFPRDDVLASRSRLAALATPLHENALVGLYLDSHDLSEVSKPVEVVRMRVDARDGRLDLQRPTVQRDVLLSARRQLTSLRATAAGFRYVVRADGRTVIDLDSDVCDPSPRGAVARRLERWYHGACT